MRFTKNVCHITLWEKNLTVLSKQERMRYFASFPFREGQQGLDPGGLRTFFLWGRVEDYVFQDLGS